MNNNNEHRTLFYRVVQAQARLAMAGNRKELAKDVNPVEYSIAVRRFHVAKRAMRRAVEKLEAGR